MLGWRPSAGPALRRLKTRCIRLNSTDAASSSVPDLNARLLNRIGGGGKKRIAEDLDGIKIRVYICSILVRYLDLYVFGLAPRAEIKIYSGYSLSDRLIKIHADKPAALPAIPPAAAVPSDEPASSASSSPSEITSSSSPNDAPTAPAPRAGERFQEHYKNIDLGNLTGASVTAVHIPTPQQTARVYTHKKYVESVDLEALFERSQSPEYRRDKAPRQPKTDLRQEKGEKQPPKANVRPVRAQRGNAPSRRSQPSKTSGNARPRRPRTRRNQHSSLEIVLTGDAEIDAHVQAVVESEEKTIPDREPNVSYSYLPHSRGPAVDFALPQAEVLFNERRGPGMEDDTKSVATPPQVQLGSLFLPSHRRFKGNYKRRLPDDGVWATPITRLPTVVHAQMVSGRQSTFHFGGQKEVSEVVKSLQ
ncbi:hypothetical protein IW261DRAFT_1472250 [Armillaria novae-zelandiae]|uniref:Uncharacterized protein n=1 Tax=Armillaria novae-zelandiae TaxID=153914 RepID=A0AA39PDF5_9AGAR|nr:hypothetical protein IW261DRAFT_1472250 [Armillaria novae-zelandiae]